MGSFSFLEEGRWGGGRGGGGGGGVGWGGDVKLGRKYTSSLFLEGGGVLGLSITNSLLVHSRLKGDT